MTNIKLRLAITQFTEYFVFGSWLISLGGYLYSTMGATNTEVGSVYAMMGIASLITPPIFGMIADKWINSEHLLGICRLIGSVSLYYASKSTSYTQFWIPMMVNSFVHMPALSLNFSICYGLLNKGGLDVTKFFPQIRLFGSFGFITAMWIVNLLGWAKTSSQLLLASIASLISGIYVITLPPSTQARSYEKITWKSFCNLDALFFFKKTKMKVFFVFSSLLGICLQINNTWSGPFLEDFNLTYPKSLTVKYPLILLSISQVSEVLFILFIPFFFKKYGIKNSILLSCSAYAIRFGLFAIGDPQSRFIYLFLSMIVYGIAFDFFSISSSLFIEKEFPASIRSRSQGLLLMATNGLAPIIGQFGAIHLVNHFSVNGIKNWRNIWYTVSICTLIIGIGFFFTFKEKD